MHILSLFEPSIKHSVTRRRRKWRSCTRRSVICSFVQKQGSFEVIGTLSLLVKFCCRFMKTMVLNKIEQISSEYGSYNKIPCSSDGTELKRYGRGYQLLQSEDRQTYASIFGKRVMCVVKLCYRIRIATRSRISCIKMCTCTRVNPSSYNRQYAYNTINVHMKIHSFLWGSDCHANMISATLIIQYKSGLIELCQ